MFKLRYVKSKLTTHFILRNTYLKNNPNNTRANLN